MIPRISASITVKSTKPAIPRNSEKVWTAMYFDGADMSQPPYDIPVTAISIEYIPYIEHMMHIISRNISAL